MAAKRLRQLIHQLAGARDPAHNLDDTELLRRFAATGDEAAFEVLVWRHGPMVLGTCRRLLGDSADAEDAFQATFLTLVRKARGVRDGAALAGWLFRVAYRIAVGLRAERGRRRQRERAIAEDVAAPGGRPADDLAEVLDAEVHSLPEKYRRVVILCYLQGRSTEETAAMLGCPRGTVLSRLATARERLRRRLERRGVAPASIGALAGLTTSAEAMPSSMLVAKALSCAAAVAAGNITMIPSAILKLTDGALRSMFLFKVKMIAVGVVMAGALGGGTALLAHGQGGSGAPEPQAVERPAPETTPVAVAAAPPAAGPEDKVDKADPPEPKLPKVRTRRGAAGPENIDQAIEWLRGDQLQQFLAIESLARVDAYAPRRAEVARELEKVLNGRDRLVALKSTDALIVWATKDQVPSLLKALDDPSTFVRRGAMEALGPLQDSRAVAPVAKFLTSFGEREVAGRSLIQMGSIAEDEVRKYLANADKGAREEAARVLRQIGKTGKDDDFEAALGGLKDDNLSHRRKALQWFASADADHPRRAEAAREMGRLLKDGGPFDKQDASRALASWATKKEVPALIEVLQEERLPIGVKSSIMKALARLKDDRAISVLAEKLADPFENKEAIHGLIAIGQAAEEEVLKYLEHDSYQARVAACKVLKEIGTKKSVAPLQTAVTRAAREMYGGYRDVAAAGKAALDAIRTRR
jgi:RNA polymerase sigma factor (sigma-70 family)